MSLEDTRLDTAVRVVDRAMRATPDAPMAIRLSAFDDAYTAIAGLDAGDDDWTEETIKAAWALTEDAHPLGGPMDEVIADLVRAHDTIRAAVAAPEPARRVKPRRDA